MSKNLHTLNWDLDSQILIPLKLLQVIFKVVIIVLNESF